MEPINKLLGTLKDGDIVRLYSQNETYVVTAFYSGLSDDIPLHFSTIFESSAFHGNAHLFEMWSPNGLDPADEDFGLEMRLPETFIGEEQGIYLAKIIYKNNAVNITDKHFRILKGEVLDINDFAPDDIFSCDFGEGDLADILRNFKKLDEKYDSADDDSDFRDCFNKPILLKLPGVDNYIVGNITGGCDEAVFISPVTGGNMLQLFVGKEKELRTGVQTDYVFSDPWYSVVRTGINFKFKAMPLRYNHTPVEKILIYDK